MAHLIGTKVWDKIAGQWDVIKKSTDYKDDEGKKCPVYVLENAPTCLDYPTRRRNSFEISLKEQSREDMYYLWK